MTKYDKILIVMVVILSILGIYINKNRIVPEDSLYAYIEIDGKKHKEFSLDSSIEEIININTEYGYNKILVKDKAVEVLEADCKDKIDVKQGKIDGIGEIIVCLPNRMYIEIKSINEKEDSKIDMVIK